MVVVCTYYFVVLCDSGQILMYNVGEGFAMPRCVTYNDQVGRIIGQFMLPLHNERELIQSDGFVGTVVKK